MENKLNLRGKRKKCAEIIAEMAEAMSFPDAALRELEDGLDLSQVTDAQVDEIYKELVKLIGECAPERMSNLVDHAKAIQN